MTIPLCALQASVLAQKTRIPSLYGKVDFGLMSAPSWPPS